MKLRLKSGEITGRETLVDLSLSLSHIPTTTEVASPEKDELHDGEEESKVNVDVEGKGDDKMAVRRLSTLDLTMSIGTSE